jgi:hypothetical protein
MKALPFLILLFWVSVANASVSVPVHTHKLYIEGVLPAPYETMSLDIELNIETDDVEIFELYRGGERIEIPIEILKKMKDVEPSSLKVSHEMHRLDETRPEYSEAGDLLYITFDLGERYRAERDFDGVGYYKWGSDSLELMIAENKAVLYWLVVLTETSGDWSKKSR